MSDLIRGWTLAHLKCWLWSGLSEWPVKIQLYTFPRNRAVWLSLWSSEKLHKKRKRLLTNHDNVWTGARLIQDHLLVETIFYVWKVPILNMIITHALVFMNNISKCQESLNWEVQISLGATFFVVPFIYWWFCTLLLWNPCQPVPFWTMWYQLWNLVLFKPNSVMKQLHIASRMYRG